MLDGHVVDLDACRDLGVSMFAGEAQCRLELVLQDAAAGRLAPLYDFVRNLPAMEGAPVPFKPKPYVEHKLGLSTTFDAGRGCPFQCSFYTIIMLVTFATTAQLENVHPLEGGIFRLKHPSERRAGLPRERAFIFWPRFVWDTISKHAVIVATIARLLVLKFVITRDPAARVYKDTALTPVSDDEETTLDLLTHTTGAHAAVIRFKKIARLTGVARVV